MAVKSCQIYEHFLKHLQTCQSQTITSEPLVSTMFEACVKHCHETLTKHSSLHRVYNAGKKPYQYLLGHTIAGTAICPMFDSQSKAVMAKLPEK